MRTRTNNLQRPTSKYADLKGAVGVALTLTLLAGCATSSRDWPKNCDGVYTPINPPTNAPSGRPK